MLKPARTLSGFRAVYKGMGNDGGFARPVDTGPGGEGRCLVVALKPNSTLARMVAPTDGMRTVGAMTAIEWQTVATWHEVGHCLLGGSEMEADTFGMLVGVQSGVSRDGIAALANMREASDYLNPRYDDEHVTAAAVSVVARQYERLRADPDFMALDLPGLAAFAHALAKGHLPSKKVFEDISDVRRMVVSGFMARAHWVRSGDGKGMVSTDFRGWLIAHQDASPMLGRLLDIDVRLHDMTRVPTAFKPDRDGMVRAVRALAAKGDPTAAGMLRAVSVRTTYPEAPFAFPKAWDFGKGSDLAGRYVALDEADGPPSFSSDGARVVVRNVDGSMDMHDLPAAASRSTDPVAVPGLRR